MKKLLFILFAFITINVMATRNDSIVNASVNNIANSHHCAAARIDTVYTIEHPNKNDSLLVVTIVNGVVHWTSVINPALTMLNNPAVTSPIVAGILALWSFIWKRRRKRKQNNI